MQIIFYDNQDCNFIDKVIRFRTATWKQRFDGSWKYLPSHVELLFSDGMMFSASQYENKTRFKEHNLSSTHWSRLALDVDEKTEGRIRLWCLNQAGKKYDYLGVLGFVMPFIKDSRNRWFCSEVCCEALKQNTNLVNLYIDSSKVSPAKLKNIILGARA